jgi:outer membrane protein OmpA-like peptidoglycan-associated protein
MNTNRALSISLTLATLSLIATACGTVPPPELVAARSAYKHASLARTEAPAELHKAKSSLDLAEAAFSNKPEAQSTRDLAYVAQRKAQLATAIARTRVAERQQKLAEEQYRAQQQKSARKTTDALAAARGDLAATRDDLANTKRSGHATAKALDSERASRRDAEARAATYKQRAKDAIAALAKLAAVKQEARGLVITLSGSVLFASNKHKLLTSARSRLDQVSKALLETKDRKLTVEGHTDSQGSTAYNLKLSKRRANAVRSYLISRGYPAARVRAKGLGEERPVTDNGTAEGRANNRRVEIVVSPGTKAASL